MSDQSQFTLTVDQNPYLPVGGQQMHAVLTVAATGPAMSAATGADTAEVIIVDCSGSMTGQKMVEARRAARTAVETLRDGVHFAVLAGNAAAHQVFPRRGSLVRASAATRAEAVRAIAHIQAGGGTAIGAWLRAAADLVTAGPAKIRHAILLTDGQNGQPRATLDQDLAHCAGKLVCDSLGVGEDWQPSELQRVAETLLGTRDYVREPADLPAYFESLTRQAMGKSVAELALRVQLPKVATLKYLKQVQPTKLDLTGKGQAVGPLATDYPTGSWGSEEREYQLCVEFPAGTVGEEIRAAAVRLVLPETGAELARGNVLVQWTDDLRQATQVNPKVAYYTGQLDLRDRVREGLSALEAGDLATATAKLTDARRLAAESGSTDTARLLDQVIDFDPGTGTARLRRRIAKADKIALDVGTDRTAKMRPDHG